MNQRAELFLTLASMTTMKSLGKFKKTFLKVPLFYVHSNLESDFHITVSKACNICTFKVHKCNIVICNLAVLSLYISHLIQNENMASAMYHLFIVLTYLMSLPGAYLADTWMGKYKAIVVFAVVNVIGLIIMTYSSDDSKESSWQMSQG